MSSIITYGNLNIVVDNEQPWNRSWFERFLWSSRCWFPTQL